jgi:hypothetical protein
MPPWGADPAHGEFKNDPGCRRRDRHDRGVGRRRRRERQRRGSAEGAAVRRGWTIGKPDAVFTMERSTTSRDRRDSVSVPPRPDASHRDKWIQAIEIRPSANAQVHHVLAYTQPAGQPINQGGRLGPTNIGGVTPNKPGITFEPGVARLLRGNSDLIMQMHYTTNGKPAKDRTRIGVIYAKQPPTKLQAGGMVLQPRFVIPAYDGNAEVKGTTKLQRDTVMTSLTPHMHVRGKDMTYIAHYPDGTDEVLLSVPKYDFNWQITYELKTPKVPPQGDHRRSHRALRQLGGQQVQPGSVEGREVGRSDVRGDDDRLLVDRRPGAFRDVIAAAAVEV